MRAVSALATGLLLALLVVGLALFPMLHPTYTKLLSQRFSRVQESGLSQAQVLSVAELVREFVSDGEIGTLPGTVDGRPGFDAAAVSHLLDVRHVLDTARIVTGVLAALAVAVLGLMMARGRFSAISDALLAGAAICVVLVALAAVAGTMNFDAFFTWFHGLFFSAGTWEFPADSLLIEVFPEGFWMAAGATWAVLVLLGAAVLGAAGWLVRGAEKPTGHPGAQGRLVNGA